MRLVLVTWEDSRLGPDRWVRLEELEQPETVQVQTAGWVLRHDVEALALAQSQGNEPPQVCGIIVIPASAIRQIEELRHGDAVLGAGHVADPPPPHDGGVTWRS